MCSFCFSSHKQPEASTSLKGNVHPQESAVASQICCFRDVLSPIHEFLVLVTRCEVLCDVSIDHFLEIFIAGAHKAMMCL